MLYPKCPRCGGTADTAETAPDWTRVRAPHLTGHHPVFAAAKIGLSAAKLGYQLWCRVPGGGSKQCGTCGHGFK